MVSWVSDLKGVLEQLRVDAREILRTKSLRRRSVIIVIVIVIFLVHVLSLLL